MPRKDDQHRQGRKSNTYDGISAILGVLVVVVFLAAIILQSLGISELFLPLFFWCVYLIIFAIAFAGPHFQLSTLLVYAKSIGKILIVSGVFALCFLILRSIANSILPETPSDASMILLALLVTALLMIGSDRILTYRSKRLNTNGTRHGKGGGKEEAKIQQRRAAEIAHNAERAVKRAGYDLADAPLLLDDIGVVAYKDSLHPRIARIGGVPSDATHIRPFVVLTPHSRHEAGRAIITFSLLDEHDTVRYTSQAGYRLQHRQNFVAPNTWLELAGESTPSEKWSLHISLNDQPPVAIHRFGWHKPVELQFGSDGEIDPHTRKLIKQNRALADDEPLSLDDLLAEQHGTITTDKQ